MKALKWWVGGIAIIALVLVAFRWFLPQKSRAHPPNLDALVSQRVAWMALPLPPNMDVLGGLQGLSVKLWDAQGNAVPYQDMAMHLASNPDGSDRVLFLLPMGDFGAHLPVRGQVEFSSLNQKAEFAFRKAPQIRVNASGSGDIAVRDALVRQQYVALFVCFRVPDLRDWHPEISLRSEATGQPLFMYAGKFFRVKEDWRRIQRCNLFLFGPAPFVSRQKGEKKPAGALHGDLALRIRGFHLDWQQCLTRAEHERLAQGARAESLSPDLLYFVEWKDAPADWPYRWCPRPPKGKEEDPTVNGKQAQTLQKLYDNLFFAPVRFQAEIHLP